MIDISVLQKAIEDMITGAITFFPRLLTTLFILLLGWLLARLITSVVRRLAERIGLERILEQTGINAGLAKAQIERSGAELLALLLFWIVFLNFLLVGLENLGLTAAIAPLRNLISYLPRLLAVLVTLTAGVLLAQFLGRAAQAALSSMGVEFHQEVGQGVNILLIIMVVIVVLKQLGIDASIMTSILTNVITIIIAGLALAFGLGGREVARNVLAGYYAREQFAAGAAIVIDGEEGTLEGIGTLNAEIRVADGRIIIPNTRLTESIIKLRDSPAQPERPVAGEE
jgi:small-conductance mechanosensitive channel